MPTTQREKQAFLAVYHRQADTVYRVCYSFMKSQTDAEDLTRETFLRLLSTKKEFENDRHERAWLIVMASSLCRDALKKRWQKNENPDDFSVPAAEIRKAEDILEAVLKLPEEYKDAVYMYYYEGYTTVEMAGYFNCPESTVRSRLMHARGKLQILLGGGTK